MTTCAATSISCGEARPGLARTIARSTWSSVPWRHILLGHLVATLTSQSESTKRFCSPSCTDMCVRLNAWTTTWSLLDLPACTLPVGEIDAEADVAQQMPRKPFSAFDTRHWNSCTPLARPPSSLTGLTRGRRRPTPLRTSAPCRSARQPTALSRRLVDRACAHRRSCHKEPCLKRRLSCFSRSYFSTTSGASTVSVAKASLR